MSDEASSLYPSHFFSPLAVLAQLPLFAAVIALQAFEVNLNLILVRGVA